MKKYLMALVLALLGLVALVLGLNVLEYQSGIEQEAWCEQMMETPNTSWTFADAEQFSAHCLDVNE